MNINLVEKLFSIKLNKFQKDLLLCKHNKIIIKAGRQVGKSTIMAIYSILFAITHERSIILIISPSLRQSLLLFDKILNYAEIFQAFITKQTKTSMEFMNGSKIISLPFSDKVRGFSADLILLDECAFIDPEFIQTVIFPMLLAKKNIKIIMASTPINKNYLFKDIWESENDWYKIEVTSTEVDHINKQYVEDLKKVMTKEQFEQEILGMFINTDNIFILRDDLIKNLDLQPNLILIDLGGKSSKMGILFCRKEGDLLYVLSEQEISTHDYYSVLESLPKMRLIYDKTGLGQAMKIEGYGLVWDKNSKLKAVYNLKIAMDTNKIVINSQCKKLIQAIKSFDFNLHTNDLLSALMLAYHEKFSETKLVKI